MPNATSSLRLESVQLRGFKSFAERSLITFPHRITAIVGPNGSGKSNVFDALRWTLGGGRVSQFRAEDKTELIFHGSSHTKAMGYAEVEVVLQRAASPNHPAESLRISRSLSRDGNSTLRIGGKHARFVDVEDALAGSGLGRGNLAVIGQGEIGEVLMAEPRSLLAYVAEAAGVARLDGRRNSVLSKLRSSKEHLQRLEDIANQLETQCQALQHAAAEAQRHQELSREQLSLRYSLAERRYQALQVTIASLKQQLSQAEAQLEDDSSQLQDAQTHYQQARATYDAIEQHYRQALQAYEAKKAQQQLAQQHRDHLASAQQRLTETHAQVQQELATLRDQPAPQAPEGDIEALRTRETELSQQLESCTSQLTHTRKQRANLHAEYEALQRQQQSYQQALQHYQQRQAELAHDAEQLQQRLETFAAEAATESELESLTTTLTQRQQSIEQDEAALSQLREALSKAQHQLAQCAADARMASQEHARLSAMHQQRQGYAQGPRQALRAGIPGVIGSVADLLQVDAPYQAALAAALGRRLEQVVVEDGEVAATVLAHVKQQGGYVTLWPLTLVRARSLQPLGDLGEEKGVHGMLITQLDYEARYHDLVAQLLGNTTVVDDAARALQLAKRYPRRPRLVSVTGDVLESSGALSGGKARSGASVRLGMEQSIAEAAQQAAEQQQAQQQLSATVQQMQSQAKALTARIQTAQQQQHAQQRQRDSLHEARIAKQAQRGALQDQLTTLQQARARLQAPQPPEQQQHYQQLPTHIQQHDAVIAKQQETHDHLVQAQQRSQQQRLLLEEKLRSHRQAQQHYQQAQQRRDALSQQANALSEQRTQQAAALAEAEVALSRACAALPQDPHHAEHPEAIAQRFAQAKEQRHEREQALTHASQQQIAHQQALESLRLNVARRETALEEASQQRAQFPEGIAFIAPGDDQPSDRQLSSRLERVTRELADLGAVNHRAGLEYEQESQRLSELRQQMQQSHEACDALRALLHDIDEAVASRLETALTRLEYHFQQQTEALFGEGSQAGLHVHYASQGDKDAEASEYSARMPEGLSLHLQPANKRTKALRLLSVGERSMGALAFLFALMHIGDSSEASEADADTPHNVPHLGLPLAILDEVDAPLDEANIRRFCHFLQARAKHGTQFILVTHQKATMEIADALWGVTTREGVSQVFSIAREPTSD